MLYEYGKIDATFSAVVPAHPISGLPEIGTLRAHVDYSRHAVGTHIPEATV